MTDLNKFYLQFIHDFQKFSEDVDKTKNDTEDMNTVFNKKADDDEPFF